MALLLAMVLCAGVAGAQERLAAARRGGKIVWHTSLALRSDLLAERDHQLRPHPAAARLFTDFTSRIPT